MSTNHPVFNPLPLLAWYDSILLHLYLHLHLNIAWHCCHAIFRFHCLLIPIFDTTLYPIFKALNRLSFGQFSRFFSYLKHTSSRCFSLLIWVDAASFPSTLSIRHAGRHSRSISFNPDGVSILSRCSFSLISILSSYLTFWRVSTWVRERTGTILIASSLW